MSSIILQGFLYDDKSTYLKGSAKAPPIIRKVLNNGSSNYFDEFGTDISGSSIVDKGDFTIENYFDIEKITASHLEENPKILSLGGDHSISFPIIKAYSKFYSAIDILHIDAHADLYHIYEGDKYSHACPFARVMENKLAKQMVSVGIRTLNTHQKEQADRFGVHIIEMKDFDINHFPKFINPVYISLDMDGLDPAFAPAVSHLEPGGLTSREVINLIHKINTPVIGADIVEYNPKMDNQHITGALAAKLLKVIAGKML